MQYYFNMTKEFESKQSYFKITALKDLFLCRLLNISRSDGPIKGVRMCCLQSWFCVAMLTFPAAPRRQEAVRTVSE